MHDNRENSGFGPEKTMSVEMPSSEEDSECENSFPSVRQVIEKIMDIQCTETSEETINVNYHPPALIIFGLDQRVNLEATHSAINSLGSGVTKVTLAEFGDPSIHSAVVFFNNITSGNDHTAKDMYNKLKKYEKAEILGSKLHLIPGAIIQTKVRWFCYKVLNPVLEWTAVVCRGLLLYKNPLEIQNKLGKFSLRVEIPRIVQSALCTLIVVPSLSDAKKILVGNKRWGLAEKVDLHPFSTVFKRPDLVVTQFYRDVKFELNLDFLNNDKDDVEAISPISSSEEGEIKNGDLKEKAIEYQFFEFAGDFITKNQELSSHSGVCIKTTFSARINNFTS